MEFDRRRSPRGERPRRLATRKAERLRHGLGVEAAQPSDRCRRAERPEHTGSVEAAGSERRIVEPDPYAGRHLASGGGRHQEIAAGQIVTFGDRQSRRHHFRGDMGHGGAMRVAHGDGGDEIAVEQRRAGEREVVAADHAGLARLRQARCQRRDLVCLLALVAGKRAGEGIEQQVLAVLLDPVRKLLVGQCGRKLCQHLRCFFRHQESPFGRYCLDDIRAECVIWAGSAYARDASRFRRSNTTDRAGRSINRRQARRSLRAGHPPVRSRLSTAR